MSENHKKIRLSKSSIGELEKKAVLSVLDEEYLGMGIQVKLFEEEIADFIGVKAENVCCVSSGTAALHLSLEALDLKLGDEVLVPSITYVASLQAISATGATPILVDVDKNDLHMNEQSLKRKITNKSKAIMYVHYASNPARSDVIHDIANKYNLRVVEDAAHSFGCELNGHNIGSSGDIVCCSFDGI